MNKSYVTKKSIGLFAALMIFISAVCFNVYGEEINKQVRVGISFGTEAVSSATVSTKGSVINIAIEGSEEPISLESTSLALSIESGKLCIRTDSGVDIAVSEGYNTVTVYSDDSKAGIIFNGVHYYGSFEFFVSSYGKLAAINIIDIEDYIKGVLPSEIYPAWKPEALKAAAVVSRTYALRNISSSSHASRGFDLCNNTHCQMYEGTSKENENTNIAIEETSGIVLMYNGKLAMTPYHSSTGGFTASAAEVWGGKPEYYPYLTNVLNPFEDYRKLPYGKWESVIKPEEIMSYISSSYASKLPGRELTFEYDRSISGYISSITVTDSEGNKITLTTADKIRSFFGKLVKSSNFGIASTYVPSSSYASGISVISADGEYTLTGLGEYEYLTADGTETASGFTEVLVFDGSGYGHGVGMSQYGARDMANAGLTYQEILMTYFPGTEFVNINEQNEQE